LFIPDRIQFAMKEFSITPERRADLGESSLRDFVNGTCIPRTASWLSSAVLAGLHLTGPLVT
jgi:hypothetical protein